MEINETKNNISNQSGRYLVKDNKYFRQQEDNGIKKDYIKLLKPLENIKPINKFLIETDLGVTETELRQAFEDIEKNI
jgi:hypothetical protein